MYFLFRNGTRVQCLRRRQVSSAHLLRTVTVGIRRCALLRCKADDGIDLAEPVVKRDWGSAAALKKPVKTQRKNIKKLSPGDIVYGKEILKPEVQRMADLDDKSGRVTVKGTILSIETFVSPKRGTGYNHGFYNRPHKLRCGKAISR